MMQVQFRFSSLPPALTQGLIHQALQDPLSPLSAPLLTPTPPSTNRSDREAVRLLVIGSEYGIDNITHTLYLKHFAQIDEWSQLMPHPSGKLMRILTRYV